MKKDRFYMLLAMAAFIAILVACGSGEIVSEFDDIMGSGKGPLADLTDKGAFIDQCADKIKDGESSDICNNLTEEIKTPPSSTSQPSDPCEGDGAGPECEQPSSSSVGGDPLSSAVVLSSSSQGTPPSSSSAIEYKPSSSSFNPDAYVVPAFTCEWNPASVVSGSNTAVKVNFDKPAGAECTQKAWAPIMHLAGGNKVDEYEFTGTITPKFGVVLRAAQGVTSGVSWPAEPAGQSATFTSLWATVTCAGDGKGPGSREVQCSNLTITKAPTATFTGSITLVGAKTYSSSSIYYIGDTPDFTSTVAITQNAAAEYCGEIEFETTPTIRKALTASDVGTDKVKVTARCEKSGQVLATASAAVVPNPKVTGTCTWDTKDNKFNGGSTASIKTPFPVIGDLYGRTCTGPSFAVDGSIKGLVSAGLSVDRFTTDGQKMTKITITASCGSTAVSSTVPCDDIVVWDPNKPEYSLDIGKYSDNTGGTAISSITYDVEYKVNSITTPCTNVKFSCNNTATSVRVGSGSPINCPANNSNINIPGLKVGDGITFSGGGLRELGCTDGW